MKYLIDTNILIGLEDNRIVEQNYAEFSGLAQKHNIHIYVHEASIEDIKEDKDKKRRDISLSKISKYPAIKLPYGKTLKDIKNFGIVAKRNDEVDIKLLYALETNAADFLVTEDKGIHSRVRRYAPHFEKRVLFLAEAVAHISQIYEPKLVPIHHIRDIKAYEISIENLFFESLKIDYPRFPKWWEKCCKDHRDCWVVYGSDHDNSIAGLIVYKNEMGNNTDAVTKAGKILKICTFKVSPDSRGLKLGELLLRKILWYAQKNSYDLAYLTTYEKQTVLCDLLEYYGFVNKRSNKRGELIYEREFSHAKICNANQNSAFDLARTHYPRFMTEGIDAFLIPIQEQWHDILFPDLIMAKAQLSFDFNEPTQRPGNAIRKVYICRSQSNLMESAGAILLFYKSKSEKSPSQAITAIGVLENMERAESTDDLIRLTGGRSVYSKKELEEWQASPEKPVKLINSLLMKHITPALKLQLLQDSKLIGGNPPQSITKCDKKYLGHLLKHAHLDFEI